MTCICGVWAILYIDSSHFLNVKYATSQGTNNCAKFYAMWMWLKIVEVRVKHLQVSGDSKFLIEWANQYFNIENLLLLSIILVVQEVKSSFNKKYFTHIY
jgi:hypothetical protein